MQKLKINEKFRDLLPPLSNEEFEQLEQNIISEGVKETIKLWQGQIVDGHNRYEICQQHGLSFSTSDLEFESETDACEWIYINQLGRRNLSDLQRKIYIGKLYNLWKSVKGELTERGKDGQFTVKANVATSVKTDEKIAKEFNISPRTVRNDGKLVEILEEKPELEKPFLEGKITQKEILESKKDIEEMPNQDELNRVATYHSEKIGKKLQELQNLVVQAQSSFQTKKLRLSDFAPKICRLNFQPLKNEAKKLAEIGDK